jgi:hypothetical protein
MPHEQFQPCIDACNACAEACNACAKACLFEPNRHDLARCVSLNMDCAEVCRLATGYMARNSELISEICSFTAEVCIACAEECEGHDLSHCQRCAEACRQCARECFNVIALNRRAPAKIQQPRAGTH